MNIQYIICIISVFCLISQSRSSPIRPVRENSDPADENLNLKNVCNRFNTQNDVITNMLKEFSQMKEVVLLPIGDSGDQYRYTLSVCSPLGAIDGIANCAIKQEKFYPNSDTPYQDPKCLGTTDVMQIAPSDKQQVKVDWAEIWFFNGSKYNNHCKKLNRTARIVFVCDQNQGDNVNFQFVEEDNEDGKLCSYLFIAETGMVCVPKAYSINGFWIFLMIVLVIVIIVILVLLIGITVKRFAMGAKGWEQIPFIGMWRFIGNFLADGCDFCCRCGGRNPTMPSYLPTKTNATTDKFGVESSDDDTDLPREDEQILPM